MKNLLTERLRELRGDRTQAVFAEMLGFSTTVYGRYEKGTREPSIDDLYRIGVKTCSSVDWLIGITREKTINAPLGALAAKDFALMEADKVAERKMLYEKKDQEPDDVDWKTLAISQQQTISTLTQLLAEARKGKGCVETPSAQTGGANVRAG